MNYIYAVILGILSIIGPCTFVMIPTILSKVKESFIHVLLFFFGMFSVFIALGIIASVTGFIFTNAFNRYLYFFAGVITLISGLNMIGAVKVEYPHLREIRKSSHSFVDGILHGGVMLGCIGPQLSSVLSFIVAQRNILNGVLMIVFYGVGFLVPFFVFGLVITDRSFQSKIISHMNGIQKFGGILMMGAATYLIYFSLQGYI